MRIVGHFIVRFVQIAFGIVLASLAAALFLSIGYVREVAGPWFNDFAGERADPVLVATFAAFGAPFLLVEIFVPAMLAVAAAEIARWRGLMANLLLGALIALFVAWRQFGGEAGFVPSQGALVVLLSAGFVAGFAYWLVAGRSAGRWLDPPRRAAR